MVSDSTGSVTPDTAVGPASQSELPGFDLLGMRIHSLDRGETLETLLRFIREGTPRMVVTADASMHVQAATDPELLRIVREADLVTPDSTGILWAARRLGAPLRERVSGVDLAELLCAASAAEGVDIFFFGAAPGIADAAAEEMRRRYPGCRIVGTADGFLRSPDHEATLLARLRDLKPDVLLVAMGIPRQEKWIKAHQKELGIPLCMGVGGTLDVFSGQVRRAPLWMQKRGLEWLYRLWMNPRKFTKVLTLPVFVWRVLSRRRLPS